MSCISGVGIPDTRYLASPEFVALTSHWITVVEIPILIYGAFCIIFKTPQRMASVKLLMLNLHFWSCLSDLVISFFGIPYILLPAPAGYGLGIVDSPKLMVYLMVTLVAATGASILAVYENRYFVLFAQTTPWAKIRKPYLMAIFTLVPLILVPPYFNIPDQTIGKSIVLSQIPCQIPFTFNNREIFVMALKLDIPFYCVGIGTGILGTSIVSFAFLIFLNLLKIKLRPTFSRATCLMQRRFALSLTLQSAFLLSVVLAPVLTLLWVIAKWHHDQVINNFAFMTLSLHGAGSTIVMVFAHKPYRDYTLSKMCCFSTKWKQFVVETRQSNTTSTVL